MDSTNEPMTGMSWFFKKALWQLSEDGWAFTTSPGHEPQKTCDKQVNKIAW